MSMEDWLDTLKKNWTAYEAEEPKIN